MVFHSPQGFHGHVRDAPDHHDKTMVTFATLMSIFELGKKRGNVETNLVPNSWEFYLKGSISEPRLAEVHVLSCGHLDVFCIG